MRGKRDRDDADRLVLAAIRLTRTLQWLGRGGPLSAPQIGALVVIVYARRIVARDLAAQQQVTAATISRLLRELEARGLVARKTDANDSRLQWIVATPKGAALVSREHERRLAPLVAALRKLPPAMRKQVTGAAALIERLTGTLAAP